MSSKNRSALLRLEEESRDLAAPVRARLAALAADPVRHARFLNTLSLLEHIGGRKIMASQAGDSLSQETLKHLAEETRHAFFFKRAAERFAKQALDYGADATLAGAAARMYMGRLDAHIANALGRGVTPYLYMSLVVELRAIWFYRLYRDVLEETNIPLSLASILAEEELHLREMQTRLAARDANAERTTSAFCGYENERFRALWGELERAA